MSFLIRPLALVFLVCRTVQTNAFLDRAAGAQPPRADGFAKQRGQRRGGRVGIIIFSSLIAIPRPAPSSPGRSGSVSDEGGGFGEASEARGLAR